MSELIPVAQAARLRDALTEYLGTTFSLADPETRAALEDFLLDRESGMFRGPYVRLRLPFRPAADGWRHSLEWYEGHVPYGHQARAFERLSTAGGHEPQPTLVTTGTGSGKTEAFLYPILDHVRRARRQGVRGTKAIILYPMNALADDQAGRLADLIANNPELAEVTAALYTGQEGTKRSRVSSDGLITAREVIRDTAPDILLTNYKMLDQLLLRRKDAGLWEQSAHSLRYLVLDEFHTYDGAQGTDVAMLLRRLGLTLAAHRGDDGIDAAASAAPLGGVVPVATSATLGDGGDTARIREFAQTVFGQPFGPGPGSVITEDRLSVAEWVGDAPARVAARGWTPVDLDAVALDGIDPDLSPAETARAVLDRLWTRDSDGEVGSEAILDDEDLLLDLVRAHPALPALLEATQGAAPLTDVAAALVPRGAVTTRAHARASRTRALTLLLTTLSHVRAVVGRAALAVDTHLWTRELTRLDRAASGSPAFSWGDDGVHALAGPSAPVFPALYCRHCHRSGWGVALAPTGSDLDTDDTQIRRRHLARDDRIRPLLHAPHEDELAASSPVPVPNLAWFLVAERRIVVTRPPQLEIDSGAALPVLTHLGSEAGEHSVADDCPSCQQRDGIRFLGSAIATMLSVSLSALFGAQDLDVREKKALVFTDSVQDAAHRAGFVQARSHTLTLRSVIQRALEREPGPLALREVVARMLDDAGDDAHHRYRLLPPDLADREVFRPFWDPAAGSAARGRARRRVERRLRLDVSLEFGLRSAVGRTLESTGSAVAEVDVTPQVMAQVAREAIESVGGTGTLEAFEPGVREQIAWVRGVVERMRRRGAIEHEWFERFRREDGVRWSIWGGRPRGEGMPAFPQGASAPSYPRIGGSAHGSTGSARESDLDPVGSARGWYATWTARVLGLDAQEGATLARTLMVRLEKRGVIGAVMTESSGTTYHLPLDSVLVRAATLAELTESRIALECDTCGDVTPAAPETVDQLDGAPCLVQRCGGALRRHGERDNFYRRLYGESDVRRVIAREHTSLLPDEVRTGYEEGFKATDQAPDAPNVLVATPTLEMGIDIGDLSSVVLASLPRSVASYVQRVGRAGRLTGNALALAFVTARGDQLPRFADPLATINGAVRPPATYLEAEEILRRQYVAAVADSLARDARRTDPGSVTAALGSSGEGTYLGDLIAAAESGEHLTAFLATFSDLTQDRRDALTAWSSPQHAPGTSDLARRCHDAASAWSRRVEALEHRHAAIQASLPDLRVRAGTPAATETDKRELQTAESALRLTGKQLADLRGSYWIGALEEFGLLPNYSLLDDSVRLGVAVSWIDPDTQEMQRDALTLDRGAALALRDFAPGNTFYARGYAIEIDAVELGHDGEHVRTWCFCPRCGFGEDLGPTGTTREVALCMRCGSGAIADVRQRLDVIELREVSSDIRRDEAVISDATDERMRGSYQVVLSTQHTAAQVRRRWYVAGYGFGAQYVRDMTLTWLNLGPRGARGTSVSIGGQELSAPLFRVCDSCGKRDSATGRNSRQEHRPWCPRRRETGEHTRTLALSRTLRTEGLLVRLPPALTIGDLFALPSLRTALVLALREHLGGAPDHLAVETVVDPSSEGAPVDALLLHDLVPGGTGYLAELADPGTVRGMLLAAWALVRDCSCQGRELLACELCLLPFAATHEIPRVSRASAERHLRAILTSGSGAVGGSGGADGVDPGEAVWTITHEEPEAVSSESHLEQTFRHVFRERLTTLGATVVEHPTDVGNAWQITMAGGARWRLDPQQYVHGVRPDFVLTSERRDVPPVAIFTDGWAYHASPAVNRLLDDADKRETLRLAGYQVLGVTWEDLALDPGAPVPPAWLAPEAGAAVLAQTGAGLSSGVLDLLSGSPVDQLLTWVQTPERVQRETLARWVPALAIPRAAAGVRGVTSPAQDLASVAVAVLDGGGVEAVADDGSGDAAGGAVAPTMVWRAGSLALAVRVASTPAAAEIAVVLDDDTDVLGDAARPAWRAWLHLANVLNHRLEPTVVTTRSGAARAKPGGRRALDVARRAEPAVELSGAWHTLMSDAVGSEREALIALAPLAESGVPAPVLGFEIDVDGELLPIDLAWPDARIAVVLDADDDVLRDDLVGAGWRVLPLDADLIRDVLVPGEAG